MFIELAKVLGFIHSTCWTLNNRSNQVEHACSSSLAIQIKNLSLKDKSKEKEMSVFDTKAREPDDNSTMCRKTRANPLKVLSRKAYWEKQQLLLLYTSIILSTQKEEDGNAIRRKPCSFFSFIVHRFVRGDNTVRPGRDLLETITTGQGGGSGQDPSSIRWFGGHLSPATRSTGSDQLGCTVPKHFRPSTKKRKRKNKTQKGSTNKTLFFLQPP